MASSRRTRSTLARKSIELSIAAPQVIAQRLSRMAAAGTRPSARDRQEFFTMGAEKVVAFQQSWLAMWAELVQAQWRAAASLWAWPWRAPRPGGIKHLSSRVLAAGLAPVHAKAVANARRLSRRR